MPSASAMLAIVDADVWEGIPYIVSEYCPEGSLAGWMQENGGGAPNPGAAVDMTAGILEGLAHLHGRGVLHRDLKPANILLQGGRPRIADFGLARVLSSSRQRSAVAGTPVYMAPEAFDGARSERTDLWSVGVILYQMVERRLPYPQGTPTEILKAMLTQEPDPVSDATPPGLRRVLEGALARDPARRYPSARAFLDELKSWHTPASSAAWGAAAAKPLTLAESIDTALSQSVLIHAAREGVRGAEARRKEAFTAFLPRFSTTYGYTRLNEDPYFVFPGAPPLIPGGNMQTGTKDNYTWSVEARQPLFVARAASASATPVPARPRRAVAATAIFRVFFQRRSLASIFSFFRASRIPLSASIAGEVTRTSKSSGAA